MTAARALVALYAASTLLTLGEGSFQLQTPPYMHERHITAGVIGAAVSAYGVVSLLVRVPAGAVYRAHRAWALIVGGAVLSSLSYTGTLGAGYALAGFVGGSLGDRLGTRAAIVVLSLVPLLAAVLLAAFVRRTAPERRDAEQPAGAWWRDFHRLSPAVWLAFFVTLYIALVSGVVLTFFPIYGLAIGLSLTQVGLLQGIFGATASTVRFLSGALFRLVSYERVMPAMVVLSGASVAAIGGVKLLGVLAIAWGGLGLSRGLLRVASAAVVMDEAGETSGQRGAASGVYLAGLDLGKILGPLAGGIGAGLVGLRATFLASSVAFPLLYFALAGSVRHRERHLHSLGGQPVRDVA